MCRNLRGQRAFQTYIQAGKSYRDGRVRVIMCALFRIAWAAIRLSLHTLLTILEPVVVFVFSALALLGVLTTIFFKLVGPPSFPAIKMLIISIGFGMAQAGYRALIRVLEN